MEKILYEYFPQTKTYHYFLDAPLFDVLRRFGQTDKWKEYEKTESRYTVIYQIDDKVRWGIDLDVGETISPEKLESDIKRMLEVKQKARARELKTSEARKVARGLGYVGVAATIVAFGGRKKPRNATETVGKAVDSLFGIDTYAMNFDEEEYRKDFFRVRQTNKLANIYISKYDTEKLENAQLFRGLPPNYEGKRNPDDCLYFQNAQNDYTIIEYPGHSTADVVWKTLGMYGLV